MEVNDRQIISLSYSHSELIDNLPNELFLNILIFLKAPDLTSFASTNSFLQKKITETKRDQQKTDISAFIRQMSNAIHHFIESENPELERRFRLDHIKSAFLKFSAEPIKSLQNLTAIKAFILDMEYQMISTIGELYKGDLKKFPQISMPRCFINEVYGNLIASNRHYTLNPNTSAFDHAKKLLPFTFLAYMSSDKAEVGEKILGTIVEESLKKCSQAEKNQILNQLAIGYIGIKKMDKAIQVIRLIADKAIQDESYAYYVRNGGMDDIKNKTNESSTFYKRSRGALGDCVIC